MVYDPISQAAVPISCQGRARAGRAGPWKTTTYSATRWRWWATSPASCSPRGTACARLTTRLPARTPMARALASPATPAAACARPTGAALDDRVTMAAPSCWVSTWSYNLENELRSDVRTGRARPARRRPGHGRLLHRSHPQTDDPARRKERLLRPPRPHLDLRGTPPTLRHPWRGG